MILSMFSFNILINTLNSKFSFINKVKNTLNIKNKSKSFVIAALTLILILIFNVLTMYLFSIPKLISSIFSGLILALGLILLEKN